jgi:hypothetical protein
MGFLTDLKQRLMSPYEAAQTAMQAEKARQMNEHGSMDVRAIVLIGVSAFITAAFLPPALTALATANTTGMGPTELAVYGIIGTIILIVVILGYLKMVD